jgi:hypothetical protein
MYQHMFKAFILTICLDVVSLKFIKLFIPLIMSPVNYIFNTSISLKIFVLVAKIKYSGEFKDYRSISILPALSKTLELVISS